tara:strand:- start:999 stop:3788 length:2790 start_codon:yes stop_codon:yes gene_type:complete
MAITNAPSVSNINENWLVQFTADNQQCLDFDGSDDNITFGDILGSEVDFTIEFWCKADSINSGVVIQLSSGSGESEADNVSFNVNLQSGGEFRLFYEYGSGSNETNTTSSFDLSADTWTHVAVVRDDASGNALFYKNGALVETESASNDPTGGTSTDAKMTIGNSFANSNGFNGELAHVRVWNTARSASEIAYYYNRLVDSDDSNLVGYWKLNEGSGTTVSDFSSNSNSGTITGASWSNNGFDQFIHAFGLSFKDTVMEDNMYHGTILNRNISIRDSIDITKGTASTSNIKINSANFDLDGTDFYKLLFNGTNNYHNKEVRVHAQLNEASTLNSCQRVFTGRLVDISISQNEVILFSINSHRPWDGINFPQTQTANGIYQPVVYGDYTEHGDKSLVRDHANAVHPVPFKRKGITTDHLIVTSKSHSDMRPHYYDSAADAFLGIKADNYTAQTKDLDSDFDANTNIGLVKREMRRRFRINGTSISSDGSTTYSTPQNLLLDTYSSSGISHAYGPATSSEAKNFYVNFSAELGKVNDIDLDIKGSVTTPGGQGNTNLTLRVNYSGAAGDYFSGTVAAGFSAVSLTNGSLVNNTSVSSSSYATIGLGSVTNNNLNTVNLSSTISSGSGSNVQLDLIVSDLVLYLDVQQSYDEDKANTNNSISASQNLEYLYLGADGLTASWDSGAISHGHDAHRDLLMRFAGLDSTEPTGYSDLNTDRTVDNWKVRTWFLEPQSLKAVLDKLAYESGFVAKFSPSNELKYIYIKKSSELSASINMTSDDIDKVQVNTTSLSDLQTKINISNHLHPAVSNRYYNTVTSTNTTSRAKYNLGAKEGISSINLDMNVGTIPTTPNADCNADFYSYYNNIVGDIKIIVSCDVVNPAKAYALETGDIVTFTNMPVEMFGADFATDKYFMIVETKRSLGKVNITAREVG